MQVRSTPRERRSFGITSYIINIYYNYNFNFIFMICIQIILPGVYYNIYLNLRGTKMILLCSNGLSSKNLNDEFLKYAQNTKKAAIVVTADNIYKQKNYHVPRCTKELESFGLSVDCIDLDTCPANSLLSYDIVEFIGGNPYYLLNSLKNFKCSQILKIIGKEKILIGWSAGAVVLGPSLKLLDLYTPELNFLGLTDLEGMKTTNIEVLPHYSKFINKFENFEEKCYKYEKDHNTSVIRLNDGDGIFIDDGKIKIIHSE